MPLPDKYYDLNHKTVRNFPYITLTVPDFQKHRSCNQWLMQFLRAQAGEQ
jgi:hypothetical protein